jgi:hypothetical protein
MLALTWASVVAPSVYAGSNATPAFRQAVQVTAPTNAGTNPNASLNGISCASPGNCVAVGNYSDSSSYTHAMIAIDAGGVWGRGIEIGPPSGASSNPQARFYSVSCTAPGYCTAVGGYDDNSSPVQGEPMAITETKGVWGHATEIGVPSGASTYNPNAGLTGVACTSPGYCVAVGSYFGNFTLGMVATEKAGVWSQAVEVMVPSNGYANSGSLSGVACTSAGNCVAAGSYAEAPQQNSVLLAVEETGGVWAKGIEPLPPANSSTTPDAQFGAVSCKSAGNCVAVGYYTNTLGNFEALVATQGSGTTWNRAQEVSAPPNALANPTATPLGLSCAPAGNCIGVGYYTDTSYNDQAMASTGTAGIFSGLVEVPAPPGAKNTSPGTALNAVSCATSWNCISVGAFVDHSGNSQAMATTTTPRPSVSRLTPATGPKTGGTSVTITGTNFTGATAVHFGAALGKGVKVVSATEIKVTSPAGTGVVYVTVTTPGGTSANAAAGRFTY